MKYKLLLVIVGIWCTTIKADVQTYDGYKVFRMTPTTKEQKDLLLSLEEGENDLDFWTGANHADIPIDVMVPPKYQEKFITLMKDKLIDSEVFIDDVQARIAKEGAADFAPKAGMNWTAYFSLKDIYTWIDALPKQYPGKVTVIELGESYEGRGVKGVKISFKTGRRAVFLEAGMHAREWINHATITYIINELLTSTDPAFRKIAESFDWYIVPISNPDGYEYTHTGTRLWRKTRSRHDICMGVDPNRNWDFHWGEEGSSSSSCSDTYAGPKAFSEPETEAISKFIASVGDRLDVYLSFHSYSQLLLMPYGHTSEHLDNYDDVFKIGTAAMQSLAKRYGTKYQVGNTVEVLYKASGLSMDWAKDKFKIPIVYTYELRDTGKYGFVLPASEIIPNCLEVMDSLVTMFEESEKLGYFKLG